MCSLPVVNYFRLLEKIAAVESNLNCKNLNLQIFAIICISRVVYSIVSLALHVETFLTTALILTTFALNLFYT